MSNSGYRGVRVGVLSLAFMLGLAEASAAQSASWKLGIMSEFDTNVFLLKSSRKDDFSPTTGGNVLSGRFAEMENASDVRTTVSAAVDLRAGRRLSITPTVDYAYYAQNSARREWALGLALSQGLRHGRRLRIRGNLKPNHFSKNYLIDALDGDANGSITVAERVYAPGTYRELTLRADYRHRLVTSSRTHPFEIFVNLGLGYEERTYDDPFSFRNRSGPTVDVSVDVEPSSQISLGVHYTIASFSTTPSAQVLVLDESDVGQDLNGNLTQTDLDVRTLTRVDRSRTEHVVGAGLTTRLARGIKAHVEVEQRVRKYRSAEILDIGHFRRSAARTAIGGDIIVRFAPPLRGVFGARYQTQALNTILDAGATGDISDYTRVLIRAGIEVRP